MSNDDLNIIVWVPGWELFVTVLPYADKDKYGCFRFCDNVSIELTLLLLLVDPCFRFEFEPINESFDGELVCGFCGEVFAILLYKLIIADFDTAMLELLAVLFKFLNIYFIFIIYWLFDSTCPFKSVIIYIDRGIKLYITTFSPFLSSDPKFSVTNVNKESKINKYLVFSL